MQERNLRPDVADRQRLLLLVLIRFCAQAPNLKGRQGKPHSGWRAVASISAKAMLFSKLVGCVCIQFSLFPHCYFPE